MTEKEIKHNQVCGSCNYCRYSTEIKGFYCTYHEYKVGFAGKICKYFKNRWNDNR